MAGATGLVWTTTPMQLGDKCKAYGDQVLQGLMDLADHFTAVLESYAKSNAPWTDQTGAARAGLRAFAVKAATSVTLYLVHSVAYGIYLELGTRYMSPRAIIGPTLEANYGAIMEAARALLNG